MFNLNDVMCKNSDNLSTKLFVVGFFDVFPPSEMFADFVEITKILLEKYQTNVDHWIVCYLYPELSPLLLCLLNLILVYFLNKMRWHRQKYQVNIFLRCAMFYSLLGEWHKSRTLFTERLCKWANGFRHTAQTQHSRTLRCLGGMKCVAQKGRRDTVIVSRSMTKHVYSKLKFTKFCSIFAFSWKFYDEIMIIVVHWWQIRIKNWIYDKNCTKLTIKKSLQYNHEPAILRSSTKIRQFL